MRNKCNNKLLKLGTWVKVVFKFETQNSNPQVYDKRHYELSTFNGILNISNNFCSIVNICVFHETARHHYEQDRRPNEN